jgi:hypothetical protein
MHGSGLCENDSMLEIKKWVRSSHKADKLRDDNYLEILFRTERKH